MREVQLIIKRIFDIVLSLCAIMSLLVIPVLIIIPIIIKLTSKGPAIFKQNRVGKDGEIFQIYKFRTMLVPEERIISDNKVLTPNESITKIGKFLRKTSLDELPQLFNILNGTMSFVGPRPMLPNRIEKLSDRDKIRNTMRPGLTGLAQVNGRNDLLWADKLKFDLEYINKFNILMDMEILFKTILVVLKRDGIKYIHINDK